MSKPSTSSLEGYEEKDCVGLTFRVTGWPQDIAIQSIYLPKRMSWTNAKEVVHGFLKFDPIVTFAFIKNGKLVEATSGTIISEIVRTFGDGTITVMGRQSAGVNKKVKIEGQSFSQIYLSKFKEYYYKLGLNERFSPLESIEDFAKLFKMSTSTMRDHLRGISKKFSKSTYKKILDITYQILDKKFVVELRNEYEQNTEFVFNKLLFKKVEDFLDSLLGDNPLNVSPSIIPSQQELADIISVSRGSIRKFLEENYLLKYNNSDQIYKRFWPSPSSPEYTEPKKIFLFKTLDEQLEKYPEQKVMSITDLTKLIGKTIKGTTLISLSGWIKVYLIKKIIEDNPNFDINLVEFLADKLNSEIWYSPQKNPISYKDIKSFIETRGGKLITGRITFNKMLEIPTQRYVKIRCEKKHIFEMRVNKFLYGRQWCPNCKIRFCQKITNLYVQKILDYLSGKKVKLRRQLSLKKIFGIASDKGGRYILDNFAEIIKITGKNKDGKIVELIFKIGAEYDGIQHDIYPNPFHKTRDRFNKLQERDTIVDENIKNQKGYIIRIKAKYNFDHQSVGDFQEEIIRQLQDWTGLKFDPMPHWIYDKWTDSIIIDPTGATVDIPLDKGAPFSEPWLYPTIEFFLVNRFLGEK